MTVSNMPQTGCDPTLFDRTRKTLDRLRSELLAERVTGGHWVGELSPSALSTATAVSAISAVLISRPDHAEATEMVRQIELGVDYLARQQNADGGFGDTDRSHSNIATSYLALAASSLAKQSVGRGLSAAQASRLNQAIDAAGGIEGLRRRYGKDKTFVVPILTNLAIAGLVSWSEVAALPFEAAVFPQSMYRFLGMPVVSYAIPALVAIGQARHFHGPRAWFPLRQIRASAIGPTLRVLRRMQPESGGFLEATPLTAFVVMSLAATGRDDLEVCQQGIKFLRDSMDGDGSWPIDTNLATWVTSLSIHALSCDPVDDGAWCSRELVEWHLGCQHVERHPFTGAEPGGWGWSDLSGAVPDSDDTPAAMLAAGQIRRWVDEDSRTRIDRATVAGRDWLLKLQNRDGGWPTFCRGWGKLPFDRSSTDLTAHAARAFASLSEVAGLSQTGRPTRSDAGSRREKAATARARTFIDRQQQADGSWLPLWFGNQDRDDESNPVYGTSRVLAAAGPLGLSESAVRRGCDYLLACQNEDGGWGGGPSLTRWVGEHLFDDVGGGQATSTVISSVEETALAVDALVSVLLVQRNLLVPGGVQPDRESPQDGGAGVSLSAAGKEASEVAIIRGIEFLLQSVGDGRHRVPWPIGFYFAKLWYHERLYPLIFAVAAFGKYLWLAENDHVSDPPR